MSRDCTTRGIYGQEMWYKNEVKKAIEIFLTAGICCSFFSIALQNIFFALALLFSLSLLSSKFLGNIPLRNAWFLLWSATAVSWLNSVYRWHFHGDVLHLVVVESIKASLFFFLFWFFFDFSVSALHNMGKAFVFSGILVSVLVVFYNHETWTSGYRLIPSFYNVIFCGVNKLAILSSVSICFIIGWILYGDRGEKKTSLLFYFVLVFQIFVVCLTQCRSAILGLIPVLGYFCYKKFEWRYSLVFLFCSLCLLFSVNSRFSAQQLFHNDKTGFKSRSIYLKRALVSISHRPFLGIGLSYSKPDESELNKIGETFHCHNTLGNMALRRGLFAAIAQLVILSCALYFGWQRWLSYSSVDELLPFLTGLVLSTFPVVAYSLFLGAWFEGVFAPVFFFLLCFAFKSRKWVVAQ